MKPPVLDLRANAKVNLFLRVVGRRPDGYHDIETIFHSVGLSDDVRAQRADAGVTEVSMRLAEGVVGDAPPSHDNLAHRAASMFLEHTGATGNVRIDITKRIPIGGGLAGGSADAAATLLAMRRLFNEGHDALLEALASDLGSDVPYCLRGGGLALATGRGEKLTRLPTATEMWFVLGLSNEALLTRDVYAAWHRVDGEPGPTSARMAEALASGDAEGIAAALHNDLEAAAFTLRPELAQKKEALIEAGVLGSLLCGSGPSVLGLARDQHHAHAIAASVGSAFDRIVVASSRPACVEV